MTVYQSAPGLAQFDLSGKWALVTGSSRGIGFALARHLAAAGAGIILNSRNAEQLAEALSQLAAEGATVRQACFDVTEEEAVENAVAAIEAETGGIHILVNNAGMQQRELLTDFSKQDWDRLIATNLTSAFLVGRAVVRGMIARGGGKIINIGSVQSSLGRPSIGPYTASKGGVRLLTQGMCAEWARHNIQVNTISPGYFKTELTENLVKDAEFSSWLCQRTPAGRWGDVDELGGAVVFLSSLASNFVNGQMLTVDGGMTAVV